MGQVELTHTVVIKEAVYGVCPHRRLQIPHQAVEHPICHFAPAVVFEVGLQSELVISRSQTA